MLAIAGLVLLGGSGGHGGVDIAVFGILALVLVTAKLVGDLFERMGQPAVLGELLAGIILGNLTLFGVDTFNVVKDGAAFELLAQIGVILLLFEVGLESDLVEMRRVGAAAFIVAVVGVVAPVALGYGVHLMFEPEATWHVHLFVGAILAATSVGITARVLKDINFIDSPTGRVILGAAVIDDVLGLVILAVVVGIVTGANTGSTLDAGSILWIIAKAVAFLVGAIALGRPVARLVFRLATKLQARGVLLAVSLAFCFLVAWGAGAVGLATIVGAFAAGLVLDAVTYRDLETREAHGLEAQLAPISGFLVPVFFVVTGAKVQLDAMSSGSVLLLALALTVVAIIGKQICSAVAFGPGVDRLSVGLGMIPRGEVGLIFATVGADLLLDGEPVVPPPTYAAVIVMVLITTMVTPPILAWALKRKAPQADVP